MKFSKKVVKAVSSVLIAGILTCGLVTIPTEEAKADLQFAELEGGADWQNAVELDYNTYTSFYYNANEQSQEWFKFKTKKTPGYYRIRVTNDSGKYINYNCIYLLDSNRDNIHSSYEILPKASGDCKTCFDEKLHENEEYYLLIDWNRFMTTEGATFSIQIDYTKDAAGGSAAKAAKLTLGKSAKETLYDRNDDDWYKFKTSGSGTYKLTLVNQGEIEGSTSTNIWGDTIYKYCILVEVYDANLKSLGYYYYCGASKGTNEIKSLKKNKTYYLKVCQANSSYYEKQNSYKLTVKKK